MTAYHVLFQLPFSSIRTLRTRPRIQPPTRTLHAHTRPPRLPFSALPFAFLPHPAAARPARVVLHAPFVVPLQFPSLVRTRGCTRSARIWLASATCTVRLMRREWLGRRRTSWESCRRASPSYPKSVFVDSSLLYRSGDPLSDFAATAARGFGHALSLSPRRCRSSERLRLVLSPAQATMVPFPALPLAPSDRTRLISLALSGASRARVCTAVHALTRLTRGTQRERARTRRTPSSASARACSPTAESSSRAATSSVRATVRRRVSAGLLRGCAVLCQTPTDSASCLTPSSSSCGPTFPSRLTAHRTYTLARWRYLRRADSRRQGRVDRHAQVCRPRRHVVRRRFLATRSAGRCHSGT